MKLLKEEPAVDEMSPHAKPSLPVYFGSDYMRSFKIDIRAAREQFDHAQQVFMTYIVSSEKLHRRADKVFLDAGVFPEVFTHAAPDAGEAKARVELLGDLLDFIECLECFAEGHTTDFLRTLKEWTDWKSDTVKGARGSRPLLAQVLDGARATANLRRFIEYGSLDGIEDQPLRRLLEDPLSYVRFMACVVVSTRAYA